MMIENLDPLFMSVAGFVGVVVIIGIIWYAYDSVKTHLEIREMRRTRAPIVEDSWKRIRENQNDQNDS